MTVKCRFRLSLLIAAVCMAGGAWAAYEEVEDLVDILATGDEFIAVVEGRRSFKENRRPGETIQWQGAKGEVGAFLTDDRLLAVSVRSGQWNSRNLRISEKGTAPRILLAAHLLVMQTGGRLLVFGSSTDGFFQERLPIREPVIAAEAEGRVAAVITSDRAFGLSALRRGAAEIRFQIQERLASVDTTYNKITLRTTRRLITMTAGDAVWREIDLD